MEFVADLIVLWSVFGIRHDSSPALSTPDRPYAADHRSGIQSDGPDRSGQDGKSASFNFKVNDMDTLWISLKDKVTIVESIETMSDGNRKFTMADSDGNAPGFIQEKCPEVK